PRRVDDLDAALVRVVAKACRDFVAFDLEMLVVAEPEPKLDAGETFEREPVAAQVDAGRIQVDPYAVLLGVLAVGVRVRHAALAREPANREAEGRALGEPGETHRAARRVETAVRHDAARGVEIVGIRAAYRRARDLVVVRALPRRIDVPRDALSAAVDRERRPPSMRSGIRLELERGPEPFVGDR